MDSTPRLPSFHHDHWRWVDLRLESDGELDDWTSTRYHGTTDEHCQVCLVPCVVGSAVRDLALYYDARARDCTSWNYDHGEDAVNDYPDYSPCSHWTVVKRSVGRGVVVAGPSDDDGSILARTVVVVVVETGDDDGSSHSKDVDYRWTDDTMDETTGMGLARHPVGTTPFERTLCLVPWTRATTRSLTENHTLEAPLMCD